MRAIGETNMVNRMGPRTDPCETPVQQAVEVERELPIRITLVFTIFLLYTLEQCRVSTRTCVRLSSEFQNILCSTYVMQNITIIEHIILCLWCLIAL